MATITKVCRKSGDAYKAIVRLRGVKPFSQTFKLKKDAKAWANRMEQDVAQARAYGNQAARNMTLSDLIKKRNKEHPSKDKSVVSNLTWWKKEYGSMRLLDIDRTVVREAMTKLRNGDATRGNGKGKSKSTGRKKAPATLNRYKATLSSVFEYGREHCDLPENPCRQVKGEPESAGRVRFLSDDERKALLKSCIASKWSMLYLLVLMAITTGARLGELQRLRWKDIRFTDRRAHVYQTKNGEPRVLPLTNDVVCMLQALPRPLDGDALIFKGRHPYQPFEFRKHWNKAVKDAEIENFRFHDLRHTCASYLAQNGATLLQIADVLGHKQLEVTKRYSHLCVDHKQELVDRVLGNMK